MKIYVAPTEPAELKLLGKVNGLPELKGSDVMWSAHDKLFGIQRKTCNDLVGSIYNGKLNHEFEKMASLGKGILLLEGRWKWNRDGEWTGSWSGAQRWTRSQMLAYLATVQAKGFWVVQTDELADTLVAVQSLYLWSQKTEHKSLDTAPLIPKADRRHWVLQTMCPGIGPEMSKRLMEANGGRLPLQLTMSEDEIRQVPGWGPKRASQLVRAFDGQGNVGADTGSVGS